MNKICLANIDFIRNRILELTNNKYDLGKSDKNFMQNFYELFYDKYKLLFKAVKHSNETNPKIKFPKALDQDRELNKFNLYEKEKFYLIYFDKPGKKTNILLLSIVIVTIISFCMFPLWPLTMKFGVWYFLMSIIILLVSL